MFLIHTLGGSSLKTNWFVSIWDLNPLYGVSLTGSHERRKLWFLLYNTLYVVHQGHYRFRPSRVWSLTFLFVCLFLGKDFTFIGNLDYKNKVDQVPTHHWKTPGQTDSDPLFLSFETGADERNFDVEWLQKYTVDDDITQTLPLTILL